MQIVREADWPSRSDPIDLAMQDGAGCLAYLFAARTREGRTVDETIRASSFADLSKRTLRTMGLALEPAPRSVFFAVATAHPALGRIYSPTLWGADWVTPLMTLPGAARSGRMLFGRVYSPAVLLPRQLLPADLSPQPSDPR